ncbi:TPA: hypothetical protein F8R87_01905 [Legionella pneumophila]|nr:hypothetical protein [Legionella pneumophila]
MEVELTKDWINKSLNQLMYSNELSYRHLDPFYNALADLFKQKIHNKIEISAHEFLIACLGNFVFYDLKQEKYSPPTSLHERSRGVTYARPLNYLDIEEAKEQFNRLLDDFLEKLSVHCVCHEKKTAFSWFGLIDELQRRGKFDLYIPRYRIGYVVSDTEPRGTTEQKISLGVINLIPEDFIQHIFYEHYGLDPKIAKDGFPLVNRYNADEAAKELDISKSNLIKKCLDSSFGAYISCGKFKIQRTQGSRYNKEIIDAFADGSYPYKYYGLLRLSNAALKELYLGEITTNGKDYKLIKVQPSLSEAIEAVSLYIKLSAGQRITIDDLWFIDDEFNVQSIKKKTRNRNKKNPLYELIIEHFSTEKTPEVIWNELKDLTKDFHPIIQEVDPWENGRESALIYWKESGKSKKEKTTSRKTFENFISNLKNS